MRESMMISAGNKDVQMQTQAYCPHCKSFNFRRVHRGFIKKYILWQPPIYICRKCNKTFTTKEMNSNAFVLDPFSG